MSDENSLRMKYLEKWMEAVGGVGPSTEWVPREGGGCKEWGMGRGGCRCL